jgi:hypothetical protein
MGSAREKPSEHTFANALDVSVFAMRNGRSIDVPTGWGKPGATGGCGQSEPAGDDVRPLHDAIPNDRSSASAATSASGGSQGQRALRMSGPSLIMLELPGIVADRLTAVFDAG